MSDIHANLFDAIEFAARAHRGQFRKGTKIPYIVHPLNVAHTLLKHGCPEVVAMAGVLHDIIEDTTVTFDEIQKAFGHEIAAWVDGCTEQNREAPWEERKQKKLEYLDVAPAEVLTVSLADKLDNAQAIIRDFGDLGDALWTRFKRPREAQSRYYLDLAQIFEKRANVLLTPRLGEEFINTVREFFRS